MTTLYQLLPIAAVPLFIIAALRAGHRTSADWRTVALVAAGFAGWSIFAIAGEGLFGFWPNHTANAWGNQVWFDLLIALAIGWFLLLPRAKTAGMGTWPWLMLIVCTGSIGLLAMLARCLFLERRS